MKSIMENTFYVEKRRKFLFNRRLLMLLIASGLSIITFSVFILLSWLWPGTIYIINQGKMQAILFSTFDTSLGVIIVLACLALFLTFSFQKPRIAYWGIQSYVWLVGIALGYIQSGNQRTPFFFLLLPYINGLWYGFFFSLILSGLLFFLRSFIERFIARLMGTLNDKNHKEPHNDFGDQTYQRGYSLHFREENNAE